MDLVLVTYAVYVLASVVLTVWMGRTLHNSGKPFLERVFRSDIRLADSVNHLLLIGFYMVNLGYVLMKMRIHQSGIDQKFMMEWLGEHVGGVAMMLGVMHFMNMFIFSRIWTRNGGMDLIRTQAPATGGVDTSTAVAG